MKKHATEKSRIEAIAATASKVYSVQMDGDHWCATGDGFINLQESIAGFGKTPDQAVVQLRIAEVEQEKERCLRTVRKWKCSCCNTEFHQRVFFAETPHCLHCTGRHQYVTEVKPEVKQCPHKSGCPETDRQAFIKGAEAFRKLLLEASNL